ncbi:MAG: putative DNA binding domain-containing protein [Bacteroidetes bacterium]|nr:putative DNA binding domain-containing protein [Bacteroidota bacterium]
MLNTLEGIKRQLMVGEDSRTEFKEVALGQRCEQFTDTEAIAVEMVAFANAAGGTIFLGVSDDGIVQGVPCDRLRDVESWIVDVGTNNCYPPIRPILRRQQFIGPDGVEVVILLVEICRGSFVYATSDGRHYERVVSSKQILAGAQLARLFQERGRAFVFDEQPVQAATFDDLSQGKIERYFGDIKTKIPWQNLLLNAKIIAKFEGDVVYPTVAGLLVFGKAPQDDMPHAYIEAAVYRGTHLTSDDLVHSERIQGPVDRQIESAVKFVRRFMLKPAPKPVGRNDYPQYDIRTIREAIVNAVAHRDYLITGSTIRMFLFSDRIEIYSPGELPNTLTIESMAYCAFRRNQLLVNFLSRMESTTTGHAFIESRGEGVRTILEIGEAHAGRPPVYNLYGDELMLKIWGKPSPHETREPITED